MPKPSLYVAGNLRPTCKSQGALKDLVPLDYILSHIGEKLTRPPSVANRVLVLKAETGSGKTTALMYELYKWRQSKSRSIVVTQPRILTAVDKAQELGRKKEFYPGMELSENVGYLTGSAKDNAQQRGLLYVTIGYLLAQFKNLRPSELMNKYDYIVIDEAHERSGLELDTILYELLLFLQANHTDPQCPFVIIMSATIDIGKYTRFFGAELCDAIHVVGYSNVITQHWPKNGSPDIIGAAAALVRQINASEDPPDKCDILIFVPGDGETRKMILALQDITNVAVLPLSRDIVNANGLEVDMVTHMTLAELSAMRKTKYRRRVVVATVVAETGITIDTLRYCIDLGWSRTSSYIPVFDLGLLITCPVSLSAMRQRMGRVGRQFDGDYYPLLTKETYESIPEYELPAIHKSDLTRMMLSLFCARERHQTIIGSDAKTTEDHLAPPLLLDPLPTQAVVMAIRKLDYLGLLYTPLMQIANRIDAETVESTKMILSGYAWRVSLSDLATIATFAHVRRADYIADRPSKEYGVFDMANAVHDLMGDSEVVTSLFSDGFLEPLIVERLFVAIMSKGSLADGMQTLERRGIKVLRFTELLTKRDELLDRITELGMQEVWPSFTLPFLSNSREVDVPAVVDFVTRCKRCVWEGYKMNLVSEEHGQLVNRYGIVANVTAKMGMRVQSRRFLYPECNARMDSKSGLNYVVTLDKICPLDGFF
jgi:superfamily II DNA/RNA helicase